MSDVCLKEGNAEISDLSIAAAAGGGGGGGVRIRQCPGGVLRGERESTCDCHRHHTSE